jgi:hypothetical protein
VAVSARPAWAAAAGLAVVAVVGANLGVGLVGIFYDDGIYLALARSLAEGGGYHLLYLPGAPAAVHYPVLYPLFLAALWKLGPAFPASVALFRAANALLLGLFAALLVLYLGRRLAWPPWRLALVAVAATTALPLVVVATVLFAEPLFLVLFVAACWIGEAAGNAADGRSAWGLAALAGLLAGASALTRSLGVVAVVAVPLTLLLARRPRAAGIAVAAGALWLVPWLVWVARHRADVDPALVAGYGTYLDLLAQAGWGTVSPAAVTAVLRPLGAVALAPLHGWLRFFFGVPALALLGAGFAVFFRRAPVLAWSLAGYFGIVLVWPFGPDRFLWAAWPFLAVAFLAGAEAVATRAARRTGGVAQVGRWAVAVVVLVVVGGFAFYQVRGYARGDATRLQRGISATLEEVLPWVRQHTPPDAVIAGEDEALLWLYTGRRAVPSYVWRYRGRGEESLGPDSLRAWLDRSHVSYVLLTGAGSNAAPTLNALLGRYPGYLRMTRVWPGAVVAFAVDRSGETAGAAADSAGARPRGQVGPEAPGAAR